MGMEGRGSDQDVGSSKTVMIRMGVEVAIEVMEMMELRVVGAYVLGVEMKPPARVGWVPALRWGAWRGRSRMLVPYGVGIEGCGSDQGVGSSKTVKITMGAEGCYRGGGDAGVEGRGCVSVEMEPPAVGWVPALSLGAW
ncbi:hypothetical protein AAG906_036690 [Vitis piasezkii]